VGTSKLNPARTDIQPRKRRIDIEASTENIVDARSIERLKSLPGAEAVPSNEETARSDFLVNASSALSRFVPRSDPDFGAKIRRAAKTLFVRFQPNESLEHLVTKLGGRRKPVRDPHISLIYARLPAAVKRELADTIQLPFAEVVFDRVQLMSCPGPTESAADVESWRMLASRRLGG
jgi:hypothetical protein